LADCARVPRGGQTTREEHFVADPDSIALDDFLGRRHGDRKRHDLVVRCVKIPETEDRNVRERIGWVAEPAVMLFYLDGLWLI
jgi:hypothetical protein